MPQLRRFGAPVGAPGVVVYERSGINQIPNPLFGSTFMLGIMPRGPMGVGVPVRSRKQLDDIYNDPSDPRWWLDATGSHLLPDAVDGFFARGGGAGTLILTRLDLDGTAKRAEKVFKGRNGSDALRVRAANEGRWGGYQNSVPLTPVIYATVRTFTLIAPGVEANEFRGAEAEFPGASTKVYQVVSNTKANPKSGEVVFTIGSQFNLLDDSVTGPAAIVGTASYDTRSTLTGTIAFPLQSGLTGTSNINGLVVTGVGTEYSTELTVGDRIYYNGEARVVDSITSDTTLTITTPFSTEQVNGVTLSRDNLVVTGTGTTFAASLKVGETLYAVVNGVTEGRTVAAITSATSLTLSSGFTDALTAGTQVQKANYTVTGTGTQFLTDLTVGQYLVDPNRSGSTVKITAIASATALTIEKPFTADFDDAQLTKQSHLGKVTLTAPRDKGLAIEITQGLRKPETHFSLVVYFNDSRILEVPDCSLDPADPDFVNTKVSQLNIAHSDGTNNYATWITAESLWTSAYTTSQDNDVRPCNGAGEILHLTPTTIYTAADLEFSNLVGQKVYPNPYEYPRGFYTIRETSPTKSLSGTISSLGVAVSGTGTVFLSEVKPGDYLYDPASNKVRKVRVVTSNTALTLETAFPVNMVALTKGKVAGMLTVGERYDLSLICDVGDRFSVVHPQPLEKGYDGNTGTIIPYYFTKFADADYNHIEKACLNKNLGRVAIAVPGISDVTIQKAFAFYASTKAYEFRAEIPSYITQAAVAETYVSRQLGRNDFISVAFPSYGTIANPLGAGDRFIPLSGDIMGGEASNAVAAEGYHLVFAGIGATLPRFLKLPVLLDPQDEAILNLAGIQPIKTIDGNIVVWGSRCPSSSETYKFLHVRRIQSNYIRVLIEARNLMEALFQPNQPALLDQITLMLDQFARREYDKGVLTQYLNFQQAAQTTGDIQSGTVIAGEQSRSSLVSVLNGQLNIYFRYVPTGILEVLSVSVGPDLLVEEYGKTINVS